MTGVRRSSAQRVSVGFILAAAALTFLSMFGLWYWRYIPALDYYAHVECAGVLKKLFSPLSALHANYDLNFFTPYLIPYLAIAALNSVFNIEIAAKLVLSLSILALPLALFCLYKRQQYDYWWSLAGFGLAFGTSYQVGFLPQTAAIPIGFFFLNSLLNLRSQQTFKAAAISSLWAIVLFFSHLFILCFTCLLGACILFFKQRSLRSIIPMAMPIVLSAILVIFWLLAPSGRPTVANLTPTWSVGIERVLQTAAGSFGSHVSLELASGVIFLALLFILALRPRFCSDLGLRLALLICLASVAFSPHHIGQYWFYMRTIVFFVPLLLLNFDIAGNGRSLKISRLILFAGIVWVNLVEIRDISAYNRFLRPLYHLADSLPRDKKVLFIVGSHLPSRVIQPDLRYLHDIYHLNRGVVQWCHLAGAHQSPCAFRWGKPLPEVEAGTYFIGTDFSEFLPQADYVAALGVDVVQLSEIAAQLGPRFRPAGVFDDWHYFESLPPGKAH